MNWKDTLQKKLGQSYIDDFNEIALRLLNERGTITADTVFDNLPKKLKRIMNITRVTTYLKRVPGVVYNGKPGRAGGTYTLEKSIQKAKTGGPYLAAVVNLLTDEWEPTITFYDKARDLKQPNGRPYRNTLGRGSLINKLVKYGYAETKETNSNGTQNLIRRKQN